MIHLRMRTCKDREIIVVKARCVMTPGFYEKNYSTIMHINGNIYAGEDYQGNSFLCGAKHRIRIFGALHRKRINI